MVADDTVLFENPAGDDWQARKIGLDGHTVKTRGLLRTPGSTTQVTEFSRNGSDETTLCLISSGSLPTGEAGFAQFCELLDTSSGKVYRNTGSSSSATWEETATANRSIAVRNETGGTLTKGTLVRLSGYSTGQSRYLIVPADANASAGQATHVLTADISNNANGLASGFAVVTNINTDGAAAVGDPLYLSETAGAFTQTAPTNSDSMVQKVAIVITKHATTGSALFFPEFGVVDRIGRNQLQSGVISPSYLSPSGTLTATADGTGTGSTAVDSLHNEVTSASATNQISLPGSSSAIIGKTYTYWVGANGFELITPAGSNATINGTDADGTNQADIPANSFTRCTLVSNNTWIMENIASNGTVSAAIVPDND